MGVLGLRPGVAATTRRVPAGWYDAGAPACGCAKGVRPVASVKEEIRRLLEQLPDDCSLEDVQYHLYVRQKIELSLADARQGHVVAQEEAERRLARWIEK